MKNIIKLNGNHDFTKENFQGEFSIINGGNSMGASCYLLKLKGIDILLDCGIAIEGESGVGNTNFNRLKGFGVENINEIDIALVTHSHLDHCGALVEFYRQAYAVPVYMTKETKELIEPMLSSIYGKNNYNVSCVIDSVETLEMNKEEEFILKNKSVKITPIRAGHILGAVMYKIEIDGYKVLFTGDYSCFDQNTVKGAKVNEIGNVDVVITENTYANNKNEFCYDRNQEEFQFAKEIEDLIKKGKNVLIPVFALGRSQEILSILRKNIKNRDFPIYVDGEIKKICNIYSKFTMENYEEFIFIENENKRNKLLEKLKEEKGICIIASSGMLHDGSASAFYGEYMIEQNNCEIIITGYQECETPGGRLKNYMCNKYVDINKKVHKVNCNIRERCFSAHSGIEDIVSLIVASKASKVILVHGNAEKDEKTYIHKVLNEIEGLEVCQGFNNGVYKI